MSVAKKTRVRKVKTDKEKEFAKSLNKARKQLPINTLEIELLPDENYLSFRKSKKGHIYSSNNGFKHIIGISEEMRQIRNTLVSVLMKNYNQLYRTKKYRQLLKKYRKLSEQILKLELNKESDKDLIENLKLDKQKTGNNLEDMKIQYNVTKAFIVDYASFLKSQVFTKVDGVLALKCADRVWLSMEKLMFGEAEKISFLKQGHFPSLEGKQANRCLILKIDKQDKMYLKHGDFKFYLKIKKDDLYAQETINYIKEYMVNGDEIDKNNVKLVNLGKKPISTYRVLYNRIVIKKIRGKHRLFLQIVYEGKTVPKRKKDGSFRHEFGIGRVATDVGTQSVASVSSNEVIFKNLAERGKKALDFERKIRLIQRAMDRSRRVNNKDFYNEDGTIKPYKERPKNSKWVNSKNYLQLKKKYFEMNRKAAASRIYAINEDVNRLRSLGDEAIVEQMNIKALQKKAKETTVNEKTGRINRKKRFGKSIANRCPGAFIAQLKYRFESTGGTYKEVNTWTFKASQYDHMLMDCNKKQLSQRWHLFKNGIKVQRDMYSAMLLYCSDSEYSKPDNDLCNKFFSKFLKMHNICIDDIKVNKIKVLNSGIKLN